MAKRMPERTELDKQLCHPYINENGKKVTGAAALNHHIHTEHGSISEYNKFVSRHAIAQFVEDYGDVINEAVYYDAERRRNLKVAK